MTDNVDSRNDIITDLLIEAFDLGKLMEEYEAHYQRGFEAGKASIGTEQLKAEFERGRESYRDELLASLDAKYKPAAIIPPAAPKAPIANSIEAAKPARPKPTDIDRPEDIPSNFEMCRLALLDAGRPLSTVEIRDIVAKRWWPNVPGDWKSSPYGFLGSGKLRKNAEGKFLLPEQAKPATTAAKPEPQEIINREVAKRVESPKPRNVAPAPVAPRPQAVIPFEHKGRSAMLATSREYSMASRLKKAMGAGHVAEGFLAQNVIGSNTEHTRMLVKDLCLGMNPALLSIGLKIEHYPGFGLLMKDAG